MAAVLTARPGDLAFHGVSKVKTISTIILRHYNPFHSFSLTEYITDFSKGYGTWDITKDQMQKKRIQWPSTKPDTEEI